MAGSVATQRQTNSNNNNNRPPVRKRERARSIGDRKRWVVQGNVNKHALLPHFIVVVSYVRLGLVSFCGLLTDKLDVCAVDSSSCQLHLLPLSAQLFLFVSSSSSTHLESRTHAHLFRCNLRVCALVLLGFTILFSFLLGSSCVPLSLI